MGGGGDLDYRQEARLTIGVQRMKSDIEIYHFGLQATILLLVLVTFPRAAGQCPEKYVPKYLESRQPDICYFLVCAEIDTMRFVSADTFKSNYVRLKDSDKVVTSLWKVTFRDIFMVRGAGDIEGIIYYRARALYSEKPILPYLHKKQVYCLMPTGKVMNDSTCMNKIDTLFLWIGYDPILFKKGVYEGDSFIDMPQERSMEHKIEEVYRKLMVDNTAIDKKR